MPSRVWMARLRWRRRWQSGCVARRWLVLPRLHLVRGVWNTARWWGAAGRGRWHAGDIHTLLGPEKTSTPPLVVEGFGFSERMIAAFSSYRRVFAWAGVGGGVVVGCWLRCA
jgi:hypothetical protein